MNALLKPVATVLVAGSISAGVLVAEPQRLTDVDGLLGKVAARVGDYYRRSQNLICVERSIVQPIEANWSPEGLARTVESDLRVEVTAMDGDALWDAKVIRDIRRINGREPRERDKKDRSGCTDPIALSPEPLAFLLPGRREEFRFTNARPVTEQNRDAFAIDFVAVDTTSKPELIQDERGHDDCFDWTGPVATRGRVWVDAETHDVLRVERHLMGPIDVRVPRPLQRRYNFESFVTLDREDITMRYARVRFSDPEEVLLLPASIESTTLVRGGLQSMRRTDTFSDYRRFLASGRILKDR